MNERFLVVGVDISKDDFHVCIKEKIIGSNVKIKGTRSFSNNSKGFIELMEWVSKRTLPNSSVLYIMEATGTYFENLAY